MDRKVKIKFKAVSYCGKNISFTKEFSVPQSQFDDVDPYLEFIADVSPLSRDEVLIMDYIDSIDKEYLMDEKELACINDYALVRQSEQKPKKEVAKADQVEEILNSMPSDFWVNFAETTKRMHKDIKGFPIEKQIDLVLNSLLSSYEARGQAFKEATDMLSGLQQKVENAVSDGELSSIELKKKMDESNHL